MIRDEYIWGKFEELKLEDKVKVLLDALDYMAETKTRNKADCIGIAMGIPLFPKVVRIENIVGYRITLRFDNNEVRLIDFSEIFTGDKPFHNNFLKDYEKFREVEILEDTLAWPNVGTWSKDFEGNEVFDYYDIDPGFLYENSTSVEYDQAT
jgi:hypothetical protein